MHSQPSGGTVPLSPPRPAPSRVTGPVLALVLGCAYFSAAESSFVLVAKPEQIPAFWPASGLSAGILVAIGARAYLPVAVAVAAATIAANMISRSSVAAMLVFALCNALECVLAAWLVERFDRNGSRFESLRGVITFMLSALAAATAAAVPAALALRAFDLSPVSLANLWFVWFKSDAVGILVVAPLIVTFSSFWRNLPPALAIAEGLAALLLIGLATAFAFGHAFDSGVWPMVTPAALLFPLFLWLANRTHPVFSAAAVLVFAVVISWIAFSGHGRLGDASIPMPDRILAGQLAMLTVTICGLAMAASFASQRIITRDLAASEERLRVALAAAGSYAFEFDYANGSVHRVGGLLELLGLPDAGAISDYSERLHPDDRAGFARMLQSLSPAEPHMTRRYRLRTRDGDYIHIGHRAEASFDATGRLTRIIGTCTNVSARVQQETALREGEERLSQALEVGQVYVFDWDLQSNSVQRSQNAAEILGLPHDRLRMSRTEFEQHLHPDDVAAVAKDVAALSPHNPVNNTRCRFVRPDGRVVWLENTQGGTFDSEGRLIRLRGLTRDITALKQAEERQGQLIAELDHRVKNSLARMSVVIQRSRQGHETVDDYVAALGGRIDSMARTHERLRVSNWEGASIGSLVADELAPYRTARNTTVEGPLVVMSPDAAQAVSLTLHELATNAAKYGALSRDSGRVEVIWALGTATDGKQVLRLGWHEQTDWPVDTAPREGFGSRTIRKLLSFELGADVELAFTPHGVRCDIEIPAQSAVVQATA